jgi:hypothetical protein
MVRNSQVWRDVSRCGGHEAGYQQEKIPNKVRGTGGSLGDRWSGSTQIYPNMFLLREHFHLDPNRAPNLD